MLSFLAAIMVGLLVACGGGGGGVAAVPGPPAPSPSAPKPTSTPTPLPLLQTVNVLVSTTQAANGIYVTQPYAGTVSFPTTTDGSATLTTVVASTLAAAIAPSGAAMTSSPPATSGAFLCATASSTITLSGYPNFTFVVPTWYTAANDAAMYVALANPIAGNSWTKIGSAATLSGAQLSLAGPSGGPTLVGGQTYCFALYGLTTPLPLPVTEIGRAHV